MTLPPLLSAGVVVVRREQGLWRFLLLRAYASWDFPKGIVEPGEDPLDAALRETQEESTLADLVFTWGRDFRETAPYNHGRKVARYYLAQTTTAYVDLPVSPELGRPEHDEFRWCTYKEAGNLVSPRVARILDWAHDLITLGPSNRTPTCEP